MTTQKNCKWCHEPLKGFKCKFFCRLKCSQNYNQIKKRIQTVYGFDFDGEGAKLQLARLEKLGCNYTFPHPHESLNLLYNLGEKRNAKK